MEDHEHSRVNEWGDDEGLRMESLEQMMNDELEAERNRMEQERLNRSQQRNYHRDDSGGSSYSHRHRGGVTEQDPENDWKQMLSSLSFPFGSLGKEEGRLLRKSSIYPVARNFTSRKGRAYSDGSLLDSIPPLVPYKACRSSEETVASVNTATTYAETNTLSDSASSFAPSMRRSSTASVLLDGSLGDMSVTNYSASTIATSRGWYDSDAASMAGSTERQIPSADPPSPRRKSYSQPYAHRQERYERGNYPAPRKRRYSAPVKDFTRERYYHTSEVIDDDIPLYGSDRPLYGVARCSQRLDEEDEDDAVAGEMNDLSTQGRAIHMSDLKRHHPRKLHHKAPPFPSCSQERYSPSFHEPDRLNRSTQSPLQRPLNMPYQSSYLDQSKPSFLTPIERNPSFPGNPPEWRCSRRAPSHEGSFDQGLIPYEDSMQDSGHNLSPPCRPLFQGSASCMPCITGMKPDWNGGGGGSGGSSPHSRHTYPFDTPTDRRYHRRCQAREVDAGEGPSIPEETYVFRVEPPERRRRSGSRREEHRSSWPAIRPMGGRSPVGSEYIGQPGGTPVISAHSGRQSMCTTEGSSLPPGHDSGGSRRFLSNTSYGEEPLCSRGARLPPTQCIEVGRGPNLCSSERTGEESLPSYANEGRRSSPCNTPLQDGGETQCNELPGNLPGDGASPSSGSSSRIRDGEPVQSIEIAPGETATLRDAKAIRASIVNDYYVPKVCYGCSLDLFCIKDVAFFVCPVCKVVSPMSHEPDEGSLSEPSSRSRQRDACTGFTFETLFHLQAEILKDESTSHDS